MKWIKENWLLLLGAVIGFVFLRGTILRMFDGKTGLFPSLMGETDYQQEVEKQETVINRTEVDVPKMSVSMESIATRADLSYQAMYHPGTDEKMLFDQVANLNTEDLRALYKAFGIKKDKFLLIPVFTGNLINWYQYELSGNTLEKMKQIWKNTGIWT